MGTFLFLILHIKTLNKLSVTIEKNIHKYDKIMEKYFANRTELVATEKKDWSGSVAQVYNHVYYPSVYEALIKKGFSNDK